jgi:hypothetical protein
MLIHDEITEKGEKLTFSNLPLSAQKSIIQYMGIDGDDWSELIEDIDVSTDDGWNKAIAVTCKEHGDNIYTIYDVPVNVFKDLIMQTPSDFAGWHDTFQDYHEWFIKGENLPNYPDVERWPAIAWCDSEGFIDGWHRIHDYIASGHQTIPTIL